MPEDHPLWQLVMRLGGSCSLAFTHRVTHVVVAPDPGAPGGLLPLAAASDVPVLVSQPEPSWLDADTKQR